MTQVDHAYGASETSTKLGFTSDELAAFTRQCLLPRSVDMSRAYVYNAGYIDNLAAYFRHARAINFTTIDEYTMRLFHLSYSEGSQGSSSYAQCKLLEAQNKIVRWSKVREAIGIDKLPQSPEDWIGRRAFMAVYMHGAYFLSSVYAAHIKMLYSWPTLQDVARKLGERYGTIAAKHKHRYHSVRMPDGQYRIDPASLKRDAIPSNLMTAVDAARILGVNVEPVYIAVRRQWMTGRTIGDTVFVERRSLEQWQKAFATISSGFEWLEPLLETAESTELISGKDLAVRLSVDPSAVSRWISKGLLPYYIRSFGTESKRRKSIPVLYVERMEQFLQANRYTIEQSAIMAYRDACLALRRLV